MTSSHTVRDAEGDLRHASHLHLVVLTICAVSIPAATLTLVLAGRLDGGLALAAPACALAAIFVGAMAPRVLLNTLFCTAPLLWGLGDLFTWSGFGMKVNLPMFVGFVVLCAFAPQMLLKDQAADIERIRKLVLALALACIPAIFFAEDFPTGAGIYVRIMAPLVIMFAVRRSFQDDRTVLRTLRMMALSLCAAAILLFVAFERDELWVIFGDDYIRLGGINLPPQDLAVYLAVMVSVMASSYLLTRKSAYIFLMLPILIALYETFNRTAWLGASLLVFLFVRNLNKRYASSFLALSLVLGLVYWSAISGSLLRYASGVGSWEQIDKVLSGRLTVDLANVLNYLEAPNYHKVFGIGFSRSMEVTNSVVGDRLEIHSDYLAFLIEAGVLSLVAYVAILVVLWRRARRSVHCAAGHISHYLSVSAADLMLVYVVMGVPRAWYHEVIANLYVFGQLGLMLWASSRQFAPMPVSPTLRPGLGST